MKKINIELPESKVKEVAKLYSNQKEGLSMSVNNYLIIRQKTLSELKGVFNREELIVWVDIHNGTMFEPRFAEKQFVLVYLEDALNLEGTFNRHGADYEQMISKIKGLTMAQCFVFVEEAWRFWNVPECFNNQNFDAFIDSFI